MTGCYCEVIKRCPTGVQTPHFSLLPMCSTVVRHAV